MRCVPSIATLAATTALALMLAAAPAAAQQPQEPKAPAPGCKIPEEAAKKENPTKADAGSVGEGRRLYQSQCALCHGRTGDGKGDMVEPMKLTLKDYRNPAALKDMTDGAMYYVVLKGCGQMLGEEGRLKDYQMWNLVNFIRSLSKKSEVAEKQETSTPPQQP